MENTKIKAGKKETSSILVVCVGNVCRSPIGERLLADACPNLRTTSAGIKALVGQSASAASAKIAERNGVSLNGHVARQFTAELAAQFDLILVMEKAHMKETAVLAPNSVGKTALFGEWIGQSDIADPYGLSDEFYIAAFDKIQKASAGWITRLEDR